MPLGMEELIKGETCGPRKALYECLSEKFNTMVIVGDAGFLESVWWEMEVVSPIGVSHAHEMRGNNLPNVN